jgi:hypothetical protein
MFEKAFGKCRGLDGVHIAHNHNDNIITKAVNKMIWRLRKDWLLMVQVQPNLVSIVDLAVSSLGVGVAAVYPIYTAAYSGLIFLVPYPPRVSTLAMCCCCC